MSSHKSIGLVKISRKDSLIIDLLPSNELRSSIVRNLISAFGLDDQARIPGVELISYSRSTIDEIASFHDRDYAQVLLEKRDWSTYISDISRNQPLIVEKLKALGKSLNEETSDVDGDGNSSSSLSKYCLEFDCPVFPFLDEYVKITAGTTIASVQWLLKQTCEGPIAINWTGGRHHTHRDRASGFCYVNDIVIGILRLRSKFSKVMYIDMDIHHGDGVASAFKYTNKVLTCSIHRFEVGFFPGTGQKPRDGLGKGQGYEINVPTMKGLNNSSLHWIVENIVLTLVDEFRPSAVVLQCGGDGLCTDSNFSEWNLTLKGYSDAVITILKHIKVPALLLGGGGYNNVETSKLWCLITGELLIGKDKCMEWDMLPDSVDFELIGSDEITFWQNDKVKNIKDRNTSGYLKSLREQIFSR
ncbi:hypothetical protein FOA43_003843 [Brettanomyces nanus]|uniref:Histone deacetylase domain-containing protein n=1 Tax=Eeniella nana TaxID=13502 RepID=A0A875SCC3_EENNA|nr:uncharacterized protein FOA43_003843 [Brettanomyces nanus]QPG76454.1 hypothetical protein FOA43_003843 [Brettanomyces nanus]